MITLQERVHSAVPPATWNRTKLHQVLRARRDNKNEGMAEQNLLSLSYGRIVRKDIEASEGLLPESFETYQIVEPGNIVMRLTDLQNDKRSIRQGLVRERGIITSAYDALAVPSGDDPRFWAYALLALDLAKYYYSLGGGVRQSIKFSDFPNDWIARPTGDDQARIADFLDRETALIDQLIEKKLRQCSLIAHQLEASRDSLVCHGLDPSVPTKQSKVEWFGDVPAHWTVCRFNRLISSKVDYRGRTPQKVDEGIFLVTARNIRSGKIDYDRSREYTTTEDWDLLSARGAPSIGDVIFTTEAPLGQIAQVDRTDVAFAQRIIKFRAKSSLVSNDYLAELMMTTSFQRSLQLFSSGSTASGIKSERLAHLFGLAPPAHEQVEIVKVVRSLAEESKTVSDRVLASVELLREFRSTLTTAAVTGQIDVNTWGKRGQTDRRLDKIQEEMGA